jgi:hypothetical protein
MRTVKPRKVHTTATLLMLATLAALGCGSSHSASTSSPTPSPTPYFGIVKMWKGHPATLDKNVAGLWVVPDVNTGLDPGVAATTVFTHIRPALMKSDSQILIIHVYGPHSAKGITWTSTVHGYIWVKRDDGGWGPLENKELLSRIILSGL